MKISSSDVAMSGRHSYSEATVSFESLKVWNSQGGVFNQIDAVKLETDSVELSEQAKSLQLSGENSVNSTNNETSFSFRLSETDKQRIMIIQMLFQSLTGKKLKLSVPDDIQIPKALTIQQLQPQGTGQGLIYNKSITHFEAENTSFKAQAAIKTDDGREINVNLQLNLSRTFLSSNSLSIRAGDALIDPLVINYGAASASVTQEKFSFDIDADGTLDQISFAGPGSGFLALDLNNDGHINDGRELFGPKSGDGFADLAAYDLDHNGWIDENDAIYEKLRIWTKDAQGNDLLLALGEKGIGAIYLGSVDTGFALKNSSNELNAQIQKTGLFLREDGTAGTIQHVDLSV